MEVFSAPVVWCNYRRWSLPVFPRRPEFHFRASRQVGRMQARKKREWLAASCGESGELKAERPGLPSEVKSTARQESLKHFVLTLCHAQVQHVRVSMLRLPCAKVSLVEKSKRCHVMCEFASSCYVRTVMAVGTLKIKTFSLLANSSQVIWRWNCSFISNMCVAAHCKPPGRTFGKDIMSGRRFCQCTNASRPRQRNKVNSGSGRSAAFEYFEAASAQPWHWLRIMTRRWR